MTSGMTPWRRSGSTTTRLKPQPSTTIDAAQVSRNDSQTGAPTAMKNSIVKAGSMTNSPWAKLMVPDACQSSVKPSAASA